MVKFLTGLKKDIFLMKMLKRKEVRGLGKDFLFYLREATKYEKFVEIDEKTVLNSQMPPYGTKAFDRFLALGDHVRQGETIPISCHISVTDRCNFNCWHCSNWHRDKVEDLSLDLLTETIGRLQDMGNCLIGLTGGEPTMRDDLDDIIRSVGPRSSTLLFTNGSNLTEERAKELKRAGLFSVAVSLDHFRPEEHNKVRGHESAFDIAIEAIRSAKAAGLYTIAASVPTLEMIRSGDVPAFYDFCRDLEVHEVRVLAPIPTGRIVGQREVRWCNSEEEKRMWEYAKELNLKKNYPRITEFSYLESEGILGCTAGTFHIFIESDGTVTPCDMIPLSFGNIKEEHIRDIYGQMSSTFKVPRCDCYVRATVGLFKKGFEEEGKLPFSRERSREITDLVKNRKMPEFFKRLGMPQPDFDEKGPVSGRVKKVKTEKLDMRGLSCPQPIFKTQEKMWEVVHGVIEVKVDDGTAKQNVARTAEREGWNVRIDDRGDGEYLLTLSKK